MFYTDLTSMTTPSKSDYMSGARLRDLGNQGTLRIVHCCFKREGLDLHNSSDGTTVTVSLCTATCFSMAMAVTKSVLASSINLGLAVSLSDLLSIILSTSDSKANISSMMFKARSWLIEFLLAIDTIYATRVRILSYNPLSLGRMPARLFLAC
jgi:hypothetical protein